MFLGTSFLNHVGVFLFLPSENALPFAMQLGIVACDLVVSDIPDNLVCKTVTKLINIYLSFNYDRKSIVSHSRTTMELFTYFCP